VGETVRRTLIVYNDAFTDEQVVVRWNAKLNGKGIAGEDRELQIPLGGHVIHEITFAPNSSGELRLELATFKASREQFRDSRVFVVE
jgi:hypothetical protein